jgi:very-short-patch-repair endonuclease
VGSSGDLSDLIRTRIENLRPKLLDLGRRNPLISTKLTPRTATLVRIVDELPEVLRFQLINGGLRFVPLPALDDDPRDENTAEFQNAVSGARLSDDAYLAALEAVDPNDENGADIVRRIERELKDRVRASLAMPVRQQKAELSLQQHALNNGVRPQWELPDPDDENEDGRHSDTDIQTLLLPEDLERRLNGLTEKCRSWEQETGINVLHAAFGFLEWKDAASTETSFAPLALLPVKLHKHKSRDGAEFWVKADGDETETNFVLAEKLRLEFGVDLPKYEGGSIEEYLKQVADAAPPSMVWRVRRQVVVGIFPSARMAMYLDLDTQRREFEANDVIGGLFGGSGVGGATPFADEHNTDDPAIEAKAPYLVLDADSSQFSTIVDVADGKNLAVEGPPGTGKSQTIVNTIANALAQGKKVLFVAEKMAALEVVKARLESVGLGEFLLPLQAERSSREQVIESVRARIEMGSTTAPRDYDNRIEKFRQTRSELATYVEAIAKPFGRTGLKVYDVLGKSIATNDVLAHAPRSLQTPSIANVEAMTAVQIETALEKAKALAAAWHATGEVGPYWDQIECVPVDRFTAMKLVALAKDASEAHLRCHSSREGIAEYGLRPGTSVDKLMAISEALEGLIDLAPQIDASFLRTAAATGNPQRIQQFLERCSGTEASYQELAAFITTPLDEAIPDLLREAAALCAQFGFASLVGSALEQELIEAKAELRKLEDAYALLKSFVDYFPAAATISIGILAKAGEITRSTDGAALAIRSELTAGVGGVALLDQLCLTGRTLQLEREKVEELISTSTDMSPAELRGHAEALRGGGALAFLSPAVKSARKAYQTQAIGRSFDKDIAIESLTALAKWKEAAQRFSDDVQARTVFGLHFKGVDTDFYAFEMLSAYYGRVDAIFAGPTHREIRALLKTGDYDLVTAIPELAVGTLSVTFEDLAATVASQRSALDARSEAIATLGSLVSAVREPQKHHPNTLSNLASQLEDFAKSAAALDADGSMQALLGERFHGRRTRAQDFEGDLAAVSMLGDAPEVAQVILGLLEVNRLEPALDRISAALQAEEAARASLKALGDKAGAPIVEEVEGRSLADAAEYLAEAAGDEEGIHVHARFQVASNDFDELGFGWVVDELDANGVALTELPSMIEAVIFRAMAVSVYTVHGSTFAKYPGAKLDELRASIARLDRDIIKLSRGQLRANLVRSARPPSGNSIGRKSDLTELALLAHETSKKTKFAPVRDLTRRAGRALLELKPCWMMSPLAVAQYLPSTAMFDLCIIDEASQMPPEDAVGALYRARQAMVVGDTNQLPPTSFFRKMIEDEDVDEDDAVLDESILEMANGVFRPARRLRWHYRSKHSGLIAFSNEHVYDNDLIVFPSPSESRPDMGVSLVRVEGRYKSGVNGDEASAMVQAALRFMREHPDRSLGLVTLNQKQRDLLLEEWDRALAMDPTATGYVEKWAEENDGLERFFIKNLENVQGDERDVIFIGTVYGPEQIGGPVLQRFGPITGLAGKRRLNVLFSRAKKQIVTFSSMTATDIRAEEHANPGAFMLRRWLEYSATGVLHAGDTQGLEPDSDFEVYVIKQLRSMGFEPVPQVGVSGFRIDIGVRHSSWPHGFIMGVECDGATYHSSRSARDRDRLREQVLRDLGWDLHRIWSTDWFTDPTKESARLRKAIEDRLAFLKSQEATPTVAVAVGAQLEVTGIELPADEPSVFDVDQKLETAASRREQSDVSSIESVEIGDTVAVVYLDGDTTRLEVTLSDKRNAPDLGIVHVTEPLGWALFGAEKGDEIEVLVRNSLRKARVDSIFKGVKPKLSQPSDHLGSSPLPAPMGAPVPDLFGARPTQPLPADVRLEPDRFYEPSYVRTINTLACDLVDRLGPMTFRHLSELVARAHGFQRTGSQIKSQVWSAISRSRRHSRDDKGESTIWPDGVEPVQVMAFRGMSIAGEQREWPYVPYPEKLGLAIEVRSKGRGDLAGEMAARIGFARLKQTTRAELEELLENAQKASGAG